MDLLRVTKAEYRGDYCLFLKFNDGIEGKMDLEDQLWGEVFEPLKDKAAFEKFRLNEWTVEWECGADFAPESLHNHLLKQSTELAG